MLPPGHRINTTYEVVKLAGQGGMAIVYQVRHLGDGTLYALKVFVHPSTKLASYFEDEARLLRELGHPHIPSVVEIGKVEGHPFIVMEWLEGETLEERLAREQVLQLDAVIEICRQIGTVLALTHERQIVHRDMKPGNIFMCRHMPRGADPKGLPYFVKVLDFGIARNPSTQRPRTVQGTIMGTPDYMAPEQASGERSARIDSRTDQYGLAMIAYAMLSGRPAFTARSDAPIDIAAQMEAILKDPPAPLPPNVPVAVEAVLQRALSKSPADRYPSVEEFVAALITAQTVGAKAHTYRSRTDAVPPALLEPNTAPISPAPTPVIQKPPMSVLIEGRYAVKGIDEATASKLAASASDPDNRAALSPAPGPHASPHPALRNDPSRRTESLFAPLPVRPVRPPQASRRWHIWLIGLLVVVTGGAIVVINTLPSETLQTARDAGMSVPPDLATSMVLALPADMVTPQDMRSPADMRVPADLSVRVNTPSCPPWFTSKCVRGQGLTDTQRQLFADRLNHARLHVCNHSTLVLVREDNWLRSDWPPPTGVSQQQVRDLLTDLQAYWRTRHYSQTNLPQKIEIGCPWR
jgi:serine/threonine protein kinase